MISKEMNLRSLASALLNDCGFLDMDFVIDLADTIDNTKFKINGEETYLFGIEEEGNVFSNAIDNFKANYGDEHKLEVNGLIYEILRSIPPRIAELYNFEFGDEDYEIFTNCLDSHLWLKDDFENDSLTSEQIKEIKDICEEFN
jgi:hypothetical protein